MKLLISKYLLVIAVLLVSCNSKVAKQSQTLNVDVLKAATIDVVVTPAEGALRFELINNTDSSIRLHNHLQLHIERKSEQEWISLRILNCPCDAPCAKPTEYLEIPRGEKYVTDWDKHESWCGERTSMPVRETIKKEAGEGVYRIQFLISTDGSQPQEIIKEFTM